METFIIFKVKVYIHTHIWEPRNKIIFLSTDRNFVTYFGTAINKYDYKKWHQPKMYLSVNCHRSRKIMVINITLLLSVYLGGISVFHRGIWNTHFLLQPFISFRNEHWNLINLTIFLPTHIEGTQLIKSLIWNRVFSHIAFLLLFSMILRRHFFLQITNLFPLPVLTADYTMIFWSDYGACLF